MAFWVTFFLWVASFVITDYFRQRLPNQTPAGLGDFQVPTATEGRYVPLCFGTMIIKGPNVVWYGDYRAEERTVETGVIFKEDETIGFTYYLSMQLGIMRGQVAGIRRIWIGDDVVWDYDVDNGGVLGTVMDVNKPDLFGGADQGGGFVGRFRLFDGAATQAQSAYLLTQGITNLPTYRGFAYLVITNQTEDGGANIGEANTVRQMKFEIQTFDTVANGALGDSLGLGNDHHFIGDDLNPVVLAYDVFTNTDWGRGLSPTDINIANFNTAAETVWADGLGFSLVIDQVETSASLLDTIEQHIDGYIGPNPETGLMEVNLARQDYDLAASPAEVFFADETNVISVSKFSRGENNQTYNEVRIQYLDRAKDYNDTYAPAQDLANLAIQGRSRASTTRMRGVHDATVANKIAWRELRGRTRPLASATVELNRTAWNLRPGDVISLTDEEVGITNLPCRVTAVRQGTSTEFTIVVDVVQDIFGNESLGQTDPPLTEFVPPSLEVFPFAQEEMLGIEAPYHITIQDTSLDKTYPRLVTGAYAKNAGAITRYDLKQFITANSPQWTLIDSISGSTFTRVGRLRSALTGWQAGNGSFTIDVNPFALGSPADDALIDLVGSYTPGGIGSMTGVAVINPGQINEEWVIFDTIAASGSPAIGGVSLQNVWRAAMDSAMQDHDAGESIWFIWTGGLLMPDKQFTVGANVNAKLLPASFTDQILETDSPVPPSIGYGSPLGSIQFDTDFARYEKPPILNTINIGDTEFATSADFDTTITQSPFVAGITVTPVYRQWDNPNVVLQVQNLYQDGGSIPDSYFTDYNYQVSWWFYNLDENPNPVRSDAIVSAENVPITTQGQIISLEKDALTPQPSANLFNARIEIEVSHTPLTGLVNNPISPGQRTSREVMSWDFEAAGVFVIPPDAVWLDLNLVSDAADHYGYNDRGVNRFKFERSAYCRQIANPNTASPRMIGDFIHKMDANSYNNWSGGLVSWNPQGLALDDWRFFDGDYTIECQLSMDFEGGNKTILQIWDDGGLFGQRNYFKFTHQGSFNRFEIGTTANGGSDNIDIPHTGTVALVAGRTYDIAVTKKTLVNGNFEYRTYIDGVLLNSPVEVAPYTVWDQGSPTDPVPLTIGYGDHGRSMTNSGPQTMMTGEMSYIRVLKLPFRTIDYVPDQALDYLLDVNSEIAFYWSPIAGRDTGKTDDGFVSTEGREFSLRAGRSGSNAGTHTDYCPLHPYGDDAGYYSLRCHGVNDFNPVLHDGMYIGDGVIPELANLNWTMECFVRFDVLPSVQNPSGGDGGCALITGYNRPVGNRIDWFFYFDDSDNLRWDGKDGGSIGSTTRGLSYPLSGELATDVWYHCAVERIGQSLALYFDGEMVAYEANHFDTWTNPISGNTVLAIGACYDVSSIDRVRALNGWIAEPTIWLNANAPHLGLSASPQLSHSPEGNITSPPRPTYVIPTDRTVAPRRGIVTKVPEDGDDFSGRWSSHCKVACHFEPLSPLTSAIDRGPQSRTITLVNGASVASGVHPFVTSPDDGTKGSLDLTGNAGSPKQYASVPQDAVFDMTDRDTDFTAESWIQFDTVPSGSPLGGSPDPQAFIMGVWGYSGFQGENWKVFYSEREGWAFEWTDLGVSTSTRKNVSTRLTYDSFPYTGRSPAIGYPVAGTWYHVRCVRRNHHVRIFVDGQIVAEGHTGLWEPPASSPTPFTLGAATGGTHQNDAFIGYITEWRFLNGYADGFDGFAVPTEAFDYDLCAFHLGCPGAPGSWTPAENMQNENILESFAGEQAAWLRPNQISGGPTSDPLGIDDIVFTTNSASTNVQFTDDADMDLLDNDFTVEGWLWNRNNNYLTDGDNHVYIGHTNTSAVEWYLTYDTAANALEFVFSYDGSTLKSVQFAWTPSPSSLVWHHIAVVREGTFLRLYVDGTELTATGSTGLSAHSPLGEAFYESPNSLFQSNAVFRINSLTASAGFAEANYYDWKVTKRAKYSANFTPPTERLSRVY